MNEELRWSVASDEGAAVPLVVAELQTGDMLEWLLRRRYAASQQLVARRWCN